MKLVVVVELTYFVVIVGRMGGKALLCCTLLFVLISIVAVVKAGTCSVDSTANLPDAPVFPSAVMTSGQATPSASNPLTQV